MGQEVLWLAVSEPPAHLVTFLRSRGLSLVTRDEVQSASPLRLLMIEASTSPAARAPSLSGRRIAVMHPDPGNADALAQALRAKGAEVVALSLNPDSLQRAETLDPDAVIMEASDFCSSCWEIVRALWQHPHLRFATIVLATPELMGSQLVSALDVHDLTFAVNDVAAEYAHVCDAAGRLDRFSFELESLGPSRTLRALLESGRRLRVLVTSPDASIEIDLVEQIIVGAQSPAGAAPTEGLLGVHALNLLLSQRTGHVEVRTVDHPAHTNVMAPLDTALHMARDTASAVRPSGVHRPFVPSQAPSVAPAAKPKQAPFSHNRTLIGVPAVKVDAALLAGEKPEALVAAAAVPVVAPTAVLAEPVAPVKPRPSAPARPPKPTPPRGASVAPAAASGAALASVVPAVVAPERPAGSAAVSPARVSHPPARPAPPSASIAPAARVVVPELANAPVPSAKPALPPPVRSAEVAPKKAPARPPAIALEPPTLPAALAPVLEQQAELSSPAAHQLAQSTAREPSAVSMPAFSLPAAQLAALEAADADEVRSFRGSPARASAKRWSGARWFALGLPILIAALWFGAHDSTTRGAASMPSSASTPLATPVAHAEAPTPPVPAAAAEAVVAAPIREVAPQEPAADELTEGELGHQNRATARKASLLSNQGNAFRQKKMLPSARARYLEALRVYPEYPRALSGLAQLALSEGDAKQARDYAQQLVKARPGQAAYQLLLGDAYRALGDDKEARVSYQTAARLGSHTAEERLEK